MITSSSESEKITNKLLIKSHQKPNNYENTIHWSLGVNRKLKPKNIDHLWIKGLDVEKALTDDQRLEVAWLEVARDVSMFIWFEQTLIPMYMEIVLKYGDALSTSIRDYITVFAKEEIIHVLCFRRFMDIAKLTYYPPPSSYIAGFKQLHQVHPIMAILVTLLTEWVAENVAMFSTQYDYVDPLTRELFYVHHSDEVRHIAFGRRIAEDYFMTAPLDERKKILDYTLGMLDGLLKQFTYNPEISKLVSFSNPQLPYEDCSIVLNSYNNSEINKTRFKDILQWVDKIKQIAIRTGGNYPDKTIGVEIL